MISSGPNRPGISLGQHNRLELCILLHHRIPTRAIRWHFDWSAETLQGELKMLLGEGLIKADGRNGYLPTIMVVSLGDAARHMPIPQSILDETVGLILESLPEVRRRYAGLPGFAHVPFANASLLILSDVLLEPWRGGSSREVGFFHRFSLLGL